MGDEQRLGYEELLAAPGRASTAAPTSPSRWRRSSRCSTPRRSSLVNRFEEVQAAAQGTPLEPHLVGELIASEVEVKTGRCETFADIPATMAERRAQLQAVRRSARHRARRDRHAPVVDRGRTSGSSTRRTTVATTSCSATSSGGTTPSGSTSTSASAARTARSRSRTGCATCCPSCWRCRRARRSSRTSTPGCTRPGRRSSRASSRAAACRTRTRLAGVRGLRPLPLRDGLDHRAHAALVERPAAPRVPDGRDPHRRRAARPGRGSGAGGVRDLARRADRACPRRGRAARRPAAPADRGEHVARDPVGSLGRAFSISSAGTSCPTRARLERLLEWVGPVAEEIGAAPYLAAPGEERGRAADRPLRRGRLARGDLRRAGRRHPGPWLTRTISEEALFEALAAAQGLRPARADVVDGLLARLSPAVRGASRSRAGTARDRCPAGAGSRARRLGPAELLRDLEQVTTNLQLAYAAAAAPTP